MEGTQEPWTEGFFRMDSDFLKDSLPEGSMWSLLSLFIHTFLTFDSAMG